MEEDAEIAMLHSMQESAAAAWGGVTGVDAGEAEEHNGGEEEEDGSDGTNSDQEVKKEPNVAEPVLRAISPDGDSYDPLLPHPVPSAVSAAIQIQAESRSSSRASIRKPKTIGGFLADDSDEDDPQISLSTGLQPPTEDPTRSVSRSPLHLSATPQDASTPQGVTMISTTDSKVASGQASETNPLIDSEYNPPAAQVPSASTTTGQAANIPRARLPHDRVGILEDRIKEDPRGDLDAWLSLISEHRKRNKLDDARAVYERFFKVFPSAVGNPLTCYSSLLTNFQADIWVAYAEMELGNDNFYGAENIFGKSLLTVPNVNLWSVYLNYVRRRNDLTNDTTGTARSTISQAYEFVLDNIGIDRDSGTIWQEYLQFIRSAPGQIGGASWQDQQKMDQMRKAFQRAVTIPHTNVNALWKEYDQFEMSLNRLTVCYSFFDLHDSD
jgi:cleavage stimulation factor subunit 3